MDNPVSTIKSLLTTPSAFFDEKASETKWWPLILFFIIFNIVAGIVSSVIQLVSNPLLGTIALVVSIIAIPLLIVFLFIGLVISVGLTHIGVVIFGGKNGVYNTFKPVVYGGIAWAAYSVVGAIIGVVLSVFNNLALPIAIILVFLMYVHVIYIEIVGISKGHNISKLRAAGAVLIIPLIMLIAGIVIVGGEMIRTVVDTLIPLI